MAAIQNILDLVRNHRGKLKAEEKSLGTTLEQLRQRQDELRNLPLSHSEFADTLCGLIDQRAASYRARLHSEIDRLDIRLTLAPERYTERLSGLQFLFPRLPAGYGAQPTLEDLAVTLAGLFQEPWKEAIRSALGPAPELSREAREAELASLKPQIEAAGEKLKQVRAELDQLAAESGSKTMKVR